MEILEDQKITLANLENVNVDLGILSGETIEMKTNENIEMKEANENGIFVEIETGTIIRNKNVSSEINIENFTLEEKTQNDVSFEIAMKQVKDIFEF
jgi:hypothetical protein